MGDALGVGAHMRELRRIRAGPFHVDKNFTTLLELQNACELYREGDKSLLRKITMPVEYIFTLTPKVYIRDSAVDAICHGAALAIPGIIKLDLAIRRGDLIGVFTLKGEAVAIAEAIMTTDEMLDKDKGIAAKIKRVIMPQGKYPKKWKTHEK
jgi:H/ACA ribonucleoprotein complex subunit 4